MCVSLLSCMCCPGRHWKLDWSNHPWSSMWWSGYGRLWARLQLFFLCNHKMQLWPEQQQSGTPISKVSSAEVELLSITDVLLFHISWWPLCLGSDPSSLLVHSRPPFHLLWLPLSVLPKSSRLCVRTTSTKPYTSSPRDTARTTNQSVATSSLSLFPWPSLQLVSSAACSVRSFFLSLSVFTELHLIISL